VIQPTLRHLLLSAAEPRCCRDRDQPAGPLCDPVRATKCRPDRVLRRPHPTGQTASRPGRPVIGSLSIRAPAATIFLQTSETYSRPGWKSWAFESTCATSARTLTKGRLDIVLAPHEFFPSPGATLLRGELPRPLDSYQHEQPSTHWFALAQKSSRAAHHIWDINYESAQTIRARGFPCDHLPLGYAHDVKTSARSVPCPSIMGRVSRSRCAQSIVRG